MSNHANHARSNHAPRSLYKRESGGETGTAEWRSALADLTEFDRAPYDDPETYADLRSAEGGVWP